MFLVHERFVGLTPRLSQARCWWGVVLTLLSSACGGDVRPETPPLCYRGNPPEHVGVTREPQPEEWISLMTKSASGAVAERDCADHPIAWPTPPSSCEVVETDPAVQYEPVVLGPDSVIERRMPNGQRLVWVITHVRADGFALGPIALVSFSDRGVAVVALGTLRSRYERVRLQLWTVGEGQVLVAEGETCSDPELASSCRRGAQLMLRVGDAFRWVPLNDEHERCLDTAWVELSRRAEMARPDGWTRRLEYTANVQNDPRYVVVSEQVTVNDRDTRDQAAAPRLVRKIDTDRFIHVSASGLTSRQQPLWKHALADWASLERPE